MLSAERLERYSDFVDPDRTGAPYDPRQGLERLMGVLSPDPKGIVLASMGQDWYGSDSQLRSRIFDWLGELGLSSEVFPLGRESVWTYLQRREKGEIVDGSLVDLGAVVKKAEDPSQILYSRSIAGTELAIPLVQQAVKFVIKAKEYAEAQGLQRKEPPRFDSMWRVIGGINSKADLRRPLGVFDVVDFLVHKPGVHREIDLEEQTHLSKLRLAAILPALGYCGIIEYQSPEAEKAGQPGRGWSIYTLLDPKTVADLDPDRVYQEVRRIRRVYYFRTHCRRILDYIKKFPHKDYEQSGLSEQLGIYPTIISETLSAFVDLNILQRPDPGFKGGKKVSTASANGLTHIFYDLVLAPAKDMAGNLSPLPLKPWNREEVAIYLANYDEERSQTGAEGGEEVRVVLIRILSELGVEVKASYISDLYNERAEKRLKDSSIRDQLKKLVKSGLITNQKRGYYQIVHNKD